MNSTTEICEDKERVKLRKEMFVNYLIFTSKASSSSTMLVMMTETTSLEDQVANLTKLVEGLSTSLKAKDHEGKRPRDSELDEQT